jgi:glycosyltransferase involved in cell wall biosynthesis
VRVCFLSHSGDDEGASRALLESIEALLEQGVECCVMLPKFGEMANQFGRLGVPYSILPYCLWMSSWQLSARMRLQRARKNLSVTPAVVKQIREWKPDIVYSNTITLIVGAIAARLVGLPHVWHLHEFGYEDHGLVFDAGSFVSYGLVRALSKACIANSKAVAASYASHIGASKLRQVYYSMHRASNEGASASGMDAIPSRGTSSRYVIVGRLGESKGQREAIEAVGQLQRSGVNLELLIVGKEGNDGYEQYLRALAKERALEHQVMFTGEVPNAFPYMQTSDVLLMCSKSEAFGRVTVEGMLAGKPVIGARSGATPELVRDGFNGFLYTRGDVKDLAERIRYLCENPVVCENLGKVGQNWARTTFSKERHGRELLEVLSSVINSEASNR